MLNCFFAQKINAAKESQMQNRSMVIKVLSLTALLLASGFLYSCDEKPAQAPPQQQAAPAADMQASQQAPQQIPAGQAGTTVNVNVAAPTGQQVPAAMPADQAMPAEELIPEGDPTPPPPLAIQEPELVVVPSGEAQVYMVPNMVGVYFYGGYWYRHHHGVWFRTDVYNGAWVYVRPTYVPRFIIGIPPTYAFFLPRDYHRIHYREFHSNWRTWDRDRHWHRESWFQHEKKTDIRRDRIRLANEKFKSDRRIRLEKIKNTKSLGAVKSSTFKNLHTTKATTFKSLSTTKSGTFKSDRTIIKKTTFKSSNTIKGTTFKGSKTIKSNVTVNKNIKDKNIVNKNAQKNPPKKLDNKNKDIHNR
jgi:hypothetical protein